MWMSPSISLPRRCELRDEAAVAAIIEGDLDPVADGDFERARTDDVRVHAWAFIEVDHGDHIGRIDRELRQRRSTHDAECMHGRPPAALDPFEVIRPALRTRVPRHEVL